MTSQRRYARPSPIEEKVNAVTHTCQTFYMGLSHRRSATRDHVVNATHRETDDIHVPFDDVDLLRVSNRAHSLRQTKDSATLLIYRSFRRIDVLRRLSLIRGLLESRNNSPSEAGDSLGVHEDREDETPAE